MRRGLGSAKSTIKSEALFKGWLGASSTKKEEPQEDGHLCLSASREDQSSDEEEMNCDVADQREEESFETDEKPALDLLTLDEKPTEAIVPNDDDQAQEEIAHEKAPKREGTALLAGQEASNVMAKIEEDGKKPNAREHILVLVGTYSIGKERIVKGASKPSRVVSYTYRALRYREGYQFEDLLQRS